MKLTHLVSAPKSALKRLQLMYMVSPSTSISIRPSPIRARISSSSSSLTLPGMASKSEFMSSVMRMRWLRASTAPSAAKVSGPAVSGRPVIENSMTNS